MSGELILQWVVTLLTAGGGAYLGSYLREKGKSLATKEDVGHITKIVEQVKVEIGHQDWARREWTNLRRIKLEELLTQAHETERFVALVEQKSLEGLAYDARDPRPEIRTLTALYFPELNGVVTQLLAAVQNRVRNGSATGLALRRGIAVNDAIALQKAFDEFEANRNIPELDVAMLAVRSAAGVVLQDIMPAH